MSWKDGRIGLCRELFLNIKGIKSLSIESLFHSNIMKKRIKEVEFLRNIKIWDGWCVFLWAFTPTLVSFVVFLSAVLFLSKSDQPSTSSVFTTQALLNMLIWPLNSYPWILSGAAEAWVSFKRISEFLDVESSKNYLIEDHEEKDDEEEGILAISCESSFNWILSSNNLVLRNISLQIPHFTLCGVCGKVGSGKSSLLHGLVGELFPSSIFERTFHPIQGALCEQQPPIFSMTIKDNILFGSPFKKERYDEVIEICQLIPDFLTFDFGDGTFVTGGLLSGGQKQRIGLARVLYSGYKILLLDDPYSSLDLKTALSIHSSFLQWSRRHQLTVLFATNQMWPCERMDYMMVMEDGEIVNQGRLDDMRRESNQFNELIENEETSSQLRFSHQEYLEEERKEEEYYDSSNDSQDEVYVSSNSILIQKVEENPISSSEFMLELLLENTINVNREEETMVGSGINVGEDEEGRRRGRLSRKVVYGYLELIGYSLVGLILSSLLLSQIGSVLWGIWLSEWSQSSDQSSSTFFLEWSLPLIGFCIIVMFGRSFLFAIGGLIGARKSFTKLLTRVLRAPLYFFESRTVGRILNRFSADSYSIDDQLPFMANILLKQSVALISILVVIVISDPLLFPLILMISIGYFYLQNYYRCASRELRRLENVTRSPLVSLFSEVIEGRTTIRSLGSQSLFMRKCVERLSSYQKSTLSSLLGGQWLNVRLQLIAAFLTTSISLFAILETAYHIHLFGTKLNPGMVGLSLSYSIAMVSTLNGFISALIDTEKELISLERIGEYWIVESELKEEEIGLENEEKDQNEPQVEKREQTDIESPLIINSDFGLEENCENEIQLRGDIVFSQLSLTYPSSLSPALQSINLTIKEGDKVAIMGRSGSGKTSLVNCLLRLYDEYEGVISIGPTNIRNSSLTHLRRSLSFIPQHPHLFSGTILDNLDPLNQRLGDELMIDMIKKAGLQDQILDEEGDLSDEEMVDKLLDMKIDSTTTLSEGESQLICLIRSLINFSRSSSCSILCFDEATSYTDPITETKMINLIQSSLNSQPNSTLIFIAHRLSIVEKLCDRVVILDKGCVVFDGGVDEGVQILLEMNN